MLFVKDVGKKKRSKFSWLLGYRHLAKKIELKVWLTYGIKAEQTGLGSPFYIS